MDTVKNKDAVAMEEIISQSILEQAPAGIAVCDSDGIIIRANKALREFCPEDLLLRSFDQLFRIDILNKDRGLQPFTAALPLSGTSFRNSDAILYFDDETVRHVLISACPLTSREETTLGCLITFTDVTERTLALTALTKSQSEVQSLIDNLPDVITRFDRNLRCIFISPRVKEIFGITPEQAAGKTVRETGLFDEETLASFRTLTRRVFETGAVESFEFSFPGHPKNRFFSVRFVPEFDGEGNPVTLLSIMEDITERKDLEIQLEERRMQLEVANRELESFSYSVSHDLRAPLRAIDGFSRMLSRQYQDKLDADAMEKINVIRRSTRMMGQLIDDLLSFSRMARKEMNISAIDMQGLAGDAWNEILADNRGRELDITIGCLLPGMGDPSLIKQVLVNLLSNAVKFTKERRPGIIKIHSRSMRDEVVYSVTDNGVGFDMTYYHKLFGVFQRLHSDEQFEGTGVGLAIVQRIIQRLGGRVWAEGEPDKGATFSFTLPARK